MKIRSGLAWLSSASLAGASLAFTVLMGASAFAQQAPEKGGEKGGLDETGPYQVQENWFKSGIDRWNQPVITVTVDNPNRIFIGAADEHATHPGTLMYGADGVPLKERRGTAAAPWPDSEKTHLHQILVLGGDGKMIEDWSQWNDLIVIPHHLRISPYDKDRALWVVDRDGQQILKFTNDGKKLLLKLGEKNVTGADHTHFNKPASLAFLPDGSFYVADGYVNTRIVKFDKNGKYQMEWGTKGNGPGQFNLVHAVAVDSQQRVYVADRNNDRIQVFDANGKFLDQWTHIHHPTRLLITPDNYLWLAAADVDHMAKFDLNGKLQTYWGVYGETPGAMDNPHDFAVDTAGNLYIADAWNNRVQKFTARPGADKARVVGPEFAFKAP